MNTLTIERIFAPVILGIFCYLLFYFIKPQKKELYSAVKTGLSIAVLDYILEIFANKLELWHYNGKFLFLGLPVDMFLDFSLVVTNICLGYIFFKRKSKIIKIAYIFFLCIALGLWGIYHNKEAMEMGFVTFSEKLSYGTIWFISGNFILLSLTILSAIFIYELINRKTEFTGNHSNNADKNAT